MRVAVLCESPSDEVAVRILVDAILGRPTEPASLPPLRARAGGWGEIGRFLPAVIRGLHYNSDAEALVIIADSDDSPVHQQIHEDVGGENKDCRLCQLRRKVAEIRIDKPRPYPDLGAIKLAIGLAVPAIEA